VTRGSLGRRAQSKSGSASCIRKLPLLPNVTAAENMLLGPHGFSERGVANNGERLQRNLVFRHQITRAVDIAFIDFGLGTKLSMLIVWPLSIAIASITNCATGLLRPGRTSCRRFCFDRMSEIRISLSRLPAQRAPRS
jgi:hypothetical protein